MLIVSTQRLSVRPYDSVVKKVAELGMQRNCCCILLMQKIRTKRRTTVLPT